MIARPQLLLAMSWMIAVSGTRPAKKLQDFQPVRFGVYLDSAAVADGTNTRCTFRLPGFRVHGSRRLQNGSAAWCAKAAELGQKDFPDGHDPLFHPRTKMRPLRAARSSGSTYQLDATISHSSF